MEFVCSLNYPNKLDEINNTFLTLPLQLFSDFGKQEYFLKVYTKINNIFLATSDFFLL